MPDTRNPFIRILISPDTTSWSFFRRFWVLKIACNLFQWIIVVESTEKGCFFSISHEFDGILLLSLCSGPAPFENDVFVMLVMCFTTLSDKIRFDQISVSQNQTSNCYQYDWNSRRYAFDEILCNSILQDMWYYYRTHCTSLLNIENAETTFINSISMNSIELNSSSTYVFCSWKLHTYGKKVTFVYEFPVNPILIFYHGYFQ